LPFSTLVPTALGGGAGWEGARLSMPPGTQPQACQALCLADDRCAAFSYEPAGSHFVADARCALIGYGTEMRLARENGYFAAGDFWASGLKPDARLLTPESEAVAAEILADMAEIAVLRDRVRMTAADTARTESWLDVALDGHVPADSYPSFVEIAELDDYDFHWSKSRGSIYVKDMTDGRRGQIWTPAPGDYVLRYGIEHPTAGMHTITAQALQVRADALPQDAGTMRTAAPARLGTVEPGIDRPGQDIAQIPLNVEDPLACQAVCAADPDCRAWTYVNPGLQGDAAFCWTKSGVPDGFANQCCTSGVMDLAATPAQSGPADAASLDAPMMLAPSEVFRVTYTGPLFDGDWIDLITPGNEDDMSGGWAWSYVTGNPITLTAPAQEGDYTLRYVAEDPQTGRRVLARQTLAVRVTPAATVPPGDIFRRCDGPAMTTCDLVLPNEEVSLTLLSGFGITRPTPYVTAAGVAADRPSFDVVRLSDGVVVITVNPRQGGGLHCQANMLGDQMCITQIPDDGDAMVLGLVLGSLTSPAAQAEAMAGGDDAGHLEVGDAQGIWTAALTDGSQAQRNFLRLDLVHDAGSAVLEGSFLFAADFPSLPGAGGAVDGQVQDDSLTLRLRGDAGGEAMLALTRNGSSDWRGTLSVDSATYPVRLSLRAGPGEDWDGPLAWTDADPMAAALRMGAQALSGALDGMSDDDRAFTDLLGQAASGFAGAMEGNGALSEDAAALLGQLFGQTPAGSAGPASSPQMDALGGTALDLSAAEALELLAPHLGE
ncbi:MAG: PAN domain-containing protein, partial [Paracoccus sp. (in: a-proteobacteria)]|nr:PAN domain-containing protein [Paracoccus sp. (in: a-proteobacteria)]